MTGPEEHRSPGVNPWGKRPRCCIRNAGDRGQFTQPSILPVLIVVVVTFAIIALWGPSPAGVTGEDIKTADQQVQDPYEDRPWYAVGSVPLLLGGVFMFVGFAAGIRFERKRGDSSAN